MAVHVRYNSVHISSPSSAKQQREMTTSALSEEREIRQPIFYNSVSSLLRCPRFSFARALTVINKVNDLRVFQDSFFNRRCLRRRRSSFLNSLISRITELFYLHILNMT